jgi:hypothetical protein
MRRYYVYGIYEGERCFYIGKGTGDRMYHHYKRYCSSGKAVNKLLLCKFISLEKRGVVPSCQIIKNDLSEVEAHTLEIELIKKYGKKLQGGLLCNVCDGGNNPPSMKMLKEYYDDEGIAIIKSKQLLTRRENLLKLREHELETMKSGLKCNKTVKEIASEIGVTPDTVLRWAKTFNIPISGEGKRRAIIKHLRKCAENNKLKVQKTAKEYTVQEPSGNVVIVNKLIVYCRDKGIDYSNLRKTFCRTKTGKRSFTKGYSIISVSPSNSSLDKQLA